MFFVLLVAGTLVLAACGGGGGSGAGNTPSGSNTGSGGTGANVIPGASGIKDATLLGKWISADGGNGYNFKDDFSVVVTIVGADTASSYNIVEGGNGTGKVQIAEGGSTVVWDYKIANDTLDMTTPEVRSRKLRKTS